VHAPVQLAATWFGWLPKKPAAHALSFGPTLPGGHQKPEGHGPLHENDELAGPPHLPALQIVSVGLLLPAAHQ